MTVLTIEEIIGRLLVTFITVGLIGLNRQNRGHAAGLRTHLLVGLGSCLLALLQVHIFTDNMQWAIDNPDHSHLINTDSTRIIAQVVSGIGFLGAGAIITNSKNTIKGLTTAASIWCAAAIGLTVGMGYITTGIIVAVLILFTLAALNRFKTESFYTLVIEFDRPRRHIRDLFAVLDEYDLVVQDVSFRTHNKDYIYEFKLKAERREINPTLISQEILREVDAIQDISFY